MEQNKLAEYQKRIFDYVFSRQYDKLTVEEFRAGFLFELEAERQSVLLEELKNLGYEIKEQEGL